MVVQSHKAKSSAPMATGSTTSRSENPPAPIAGEFPTLKHLQHFDLTVDDRSRRRARGVVCPPAGFSRRSPNGDVPIDIVSAATFTKPASTNQTPGSRADAGSEICGAELAIRSSCIEQAASHGMSQFALVPQVIGEA